MKLKTILSLIAVAAAAKLSAISYDISTDGITAPSGATFTAINGTLATKNYAGTTVLGVNGKQGDNEIGKNEALVITFDTAQHFNSLTLGLLYNGPEFRDVYEIAAALTDASTHVFKLKALSDTTALWDGWKWATNLSPANKTGGAVWQIENPFGALKVTSLKLYPINSDEYNATTGPKSDSDFGLVAFNTPDTASTLSLMGVALLGVAMIRRRK